MPAAAPVRTTDAWAKRGQATHCARGHPFAPPNLRLRAGSRVCIACSRTRALHHWRCRYAQAKLRKHQATCPACAAGTACPIAGALQYAALQTQVARANWRAEVQHALAP